MIKWTVPKKVNPSKDGRTTGIIADNLGNLSSTKSTSTTGHHPNQQRTTASSKSSTVSSSVQEKFDGKVIKMELEEPLKGTSPPNGYDLDNNDRSSRITHVETNPWVSLARSCLVEFTGDLIFIFLGVLSALSGGGVVAVAFCHGITIAVLIASMGHISGGHFNPAVTVGVTIAGGIPIVNAIFYIFSQLLGGLIGAFFVRSVIHGAAYTTILGGATLPGKDTYPMEGIVCEGMMTYLLVATVLLTAVDTDKNLLAPVAIGLSITVDILGGGSISGASMNPARSFGPAVGYSVFGEGDAQWRMHYIYYVGPFLGAAAAGGMYRLFFGNDDKRMLLK